MFQADFIGHLRHVYRRWGLMSDSISATYVTTIKCLIGSSRGVLLLPQPSKNKRNKTILLLDLKRQKKTYILPLEHDHEQTHLQARAQQLSAAHHKVTRPALIGFIY